MQNIGTGTLKTGSDGGTTAENAVHERGSVAPEMDARNKHLRDKYSEKPKEDANTRNILLYQTVGLVGHRN